MFLASILMETTHAIKIENRFNAMQPIIISLKLNRVTSYFDVRTPTCEGYEDQNIFKMELMAEALPWDLSSPQFSSQEQNMSY